MSVPNAMPFHQEAVVGIFCTRGKPGDHQSHCLLEIMVINHLCFEGNIIVARIVKCHVIVLHSISGWGLLLQIRRT